MTAYIVRRLFIGIIMLIVMSMVTFVLFFSSPVNPEDFACGKNCSPAQKEQTRKALGYADPVTVQWVNFAKGFFAGRDFPDDEELRKAAPEQVVHCTAPCLGYSQSTNATVTSKIKDAWPISVSLALAAFVMWMLGGIIFGVIAALKRGTHHRPRHRRDLAGLLRVPHVLHRPVPLPVPRDQVGDLQDPVIHVSIAEGGVFAWMSGLMLPAFTLSLVYMAGYVRMTRAFVLESMGEDYLRTAKAKGLAPRKVLSSTACVPR